MSYIDAAASFVTDNHHTYYTSVGYTSKEMFHNWYTPSMDFGEPLGSSAEGVHGRVGMHTYQNVVEPVEHSFVTCCISTENSKNVLRSIA